MMNTLQQRIYTLQRTFKTYQDLIVGILTFGFTFGLLLAVWADSGDSSQMLRILASGLYQGMLYFMVAAGLSIIFGLMDVLNFAQGGLFMLGAYVGFDVLTNLSHTDVNNSRLVTIFVMVSAPVLLLLLESMFLAFIRNLSKQDLYSLRGTLGERLAVAVLAGVPLSYLVGTVLATMDSIELIRIIGAVLIYGLATQDHARQGIFWAIKLATNTVSFLVLAWWEYTQAFIYVRHHSTADVNLAQLTTFPEWRKPEPLQQADILAAFGGTVATAILALLLTNVSVMVISLGLAGIAAVLAGAIAGVILERVFIRPTYARPFFQIVLTFGLALVMREMLVYRYGREPVGTLDAFLPDTLQGVVPGTTIFNYWIFMITMGIIMMITVQLILQRTRIGIIIRAGVQDSEMVEALGINVRLVFTMVFALGSAIAALGGVISGGFLNIDPGLGDFFLLQAIAVVIIGGLGSYAGTAIASLMVGISRQVAAYFSRQYYNTDGLAPVAVLVLLSIILLIKPSGLFGKEH